MKTTEVYSRLLSAVAKKIYRYFGLQGGTSSSKTWTDLTLAIRKSELSRKRNLISIVSESIPHLKRGAIRDFFNIMDVEKTVSNWNATDMIYTFPNGNKMEFFSVDDQSKVRGPRRDWLIASEANNISYPTFRQLEIRTNDVIIADWNPETKFWWHTEIMHLNNAWMDISTHWDNPYLNKNIRDAIEAKKLTDPEWYRVYGQGLIGQYEGLVFKNVEIADLSKVINSFDVLYFGLDFGYFPDPAAFVVVAKVRNKVYILREVIMSEFDNHQIAETIKPFCGNNVVFCDSAEPKSIAELRKYGINARPVKKGPDSKKYRINWLKSHNLIIDKSCKNLRDEVENFCRLKDKNGTILPIFQDGRDHGIDATCYSLNAIMYQGTVVTGVNLPI